MIIKNRIPIFCLSLVVVLLLAQCIPNDKPQDTSVKTQVQTMPNLSIEVPKDTPSNNPLTQQLSTVIPTFIPLPTFKPVLTPTIDRNEKSNKVIPFLNDNGGCKLPCFWGITPGKTTWKEAKIIFDKLSILTEDYKYQDGILHDASFDFYKNDLRISVGLELFEEQQVISIIVLDISDDLIAKYYSFTEILKNYGEPKKIGIDLKILGQYGQPDTAHLQVFLAYGDIWLRIYYNRIAVKSKTSEAYLYCPNDPIQILNRNSISMIIQAVEKPLDNESLSKKLGGLAVNEPFSIEKASNIKVNEFYISMINGNKNFCLETPVKYWKQFFPN